MRYTWMRNLDISDLSIARDNTDFDISFLQYIKVSIEQEKNDSKTSTVRERIEDMIEES